VVTPRVWCVAYSRRVMGGVCHTCHLFYFPPLSLPCLKLINTRPRPVRGLVELVPIT
jgi:hypothetical protein